MSTTLRAWKETLEDLGVIGLVRQPLPEVKATGSSDSLSLLPMPPPYKPSAPPRAPSKVKEAKIAIDWKAPDDPIKNPPFDAIVACESLDALNACICKCEACPLGGGRIKFVFGEGAPTARMMFVGEGPGRDEDIMGRPFVGRAGALLDKMIAAMGMGRDEVYIANVVKCRPPDNRTPTSSESQTCLRYLYRQIELINPSVLVGLGATPLRELLGDATGITKIRGAWRTVVIADREIPFMPTFHPAYVLRQYTKEVRQAVWEDLQSALARSQL
ncbi:MAG: uracil-DNA glycosylase [Holophagales bacterium]|nr:uracil-DNA glycosylase [Holophagales bacterium]